MQSKALVFGLILREHLQNCMRNYRYVILKAHQVQDQGKVGMCSNHFYTL